MNTKLRKSEFMEAIASTALENIAVGEYTHDGYSITYNNGVILFHSPYCDTISYSVKKIKDGLWKLYSTKHNGCQNVFKFHAQRQAIVSLPKSIDSNKKSFDLFLETFVNTHIGRFENIHLQGNTLLLDNDRLYVTQTDCTWTWGGQEDKFKTQKSNYYHEQLLDLIAISNEAYCNSIHDIQKLEAGSMLNLFESKVCSLDLRVLETRKTGRLRFEKVMTYSYTIPFIEHDSLEELVIASTERFVNALICV